MIRVVLALLYLLPSLAMALQKTTSALSLDGTWQFAVDSGRVFDIATVAQRAQWRPAIVPMSWQAQFPDLRDYQGVAWYRRTVAIKSVDASQAVLLHFDAVDYAAKVYVNGALAGEHEGGYLPFEFEIGKWIKQGVNELVVRVMDPAISDAGTEGVRYQEIPHGKQNWYVQTSGLWRSVELRTKPKDYIEQVHCTASNDGHVRFDLRLHLSGDRSSTRQLTIQIRDPRGKKAARVTQQIPADKQELAVELTVPSPALWSPDHPNLYAAEVTVGHGDTRTERFGFRSFETKNGTLLLNGRPFYMIGALDQDFYPDGVYTTPSAGYLREEMLKAKQMGLNTLRCHIKVPDERYLSMADEVGLIVWYEIPNWDHWTPEAARRGEAVMDGMLARDWNHPSLCILSIINESWGIDLSQSVQRSWLKQMYERTKVNAPGRLVVDNSACSGNFHVKTDINDYHTYYAIPEHRKNFDQTVREFSTRPDWLYSRSGDAEERKDEPLILSEFGNWGLPELPAQLPWWFERKFGDAQVAHPLGVQDRFNDYRYKKIFGSYSGLAHESQRAQWDALKYEIEQLRLSPEIQGYIITEFTDINWECNGLLDMWRKPKFLMKPIAQIQQQDVVVPRSDKYNYWSGDTVTIAVSYSGHTKPATRLVWRSSNGQKGSAYLEAPVSAGGLATGVVHMRATEVKAPTRVTVEFRAMGGDDRVAAQNSCDIFVYPPQAAVQPAAAFTVYDPAGALTGLARLSTSAHKAAARDTVVVTNVVDATVVGRLKAGGTVVCLVDSNTKLPSGFPASIVSRTSPWYDGNWASNLNWIDQTSALFKGIAFGKRLGFEGVSVAPRYVLANVAPGHFEDVPAGMFIGWVHLNSAHILPVAVGTGALVLCTYRLAEAAVGDDPYAASLFARLLPFALQREHRPLTMWKP